jgi:hypothetical protein
VSLATLNGASVTRARVHVPAWGRWWADLDLAEPVAQTGAAALVVAGQAMAGTIVSGGAANGRAAYRVVGGGGGWGRTLPAKSYSDDGGVRLRTVLGDAASEAGETIADAPSSQMGPHYARPNAPASELLNLLAPQNWYVDFAGVTRIGQRAATTYTGTAPRVRVEPLAQVIDLAVDSIAGLVPGVQVDGKRPATDVHFTLDPKRLTASVYYAAGPLTRALEVQRQILEKLDPRARYRGTFEFRVVTQSGERLNLQPVYAASKMPDLANVPVRLAPGVKALHALGSLVMVAFADADPSRPYVFAGDAADAPGWMPLQLELGGPGALGVARMTDPVQAGPFSGVIVGGSARIKASL